MNQTESSEQAPRSTRSIRILFFVIGAASAAYLAYLFLDLFVFAFSESINFHGFPTNGAFQLYNPLRRLAAGQIPGHDFQFFHGLGVVFLHYPLYVLFGKNLFASEMSRWLISPLFFMGANVLMIAALTKRWSVAFFSSALMTLLTFKLLYILSMPANSLQGVRSTFPLLMAALLIVFPAIASWGERHIEQWGWKQHYPWIQRIPFFELTAAALLAVSFFFGTEHGLAACLGFGISYLFFYRERPWKQRMLQGGVIFGFFLLCLLCIYAIVSGTHLWDPLKYALIDVPKDQFWYFGAPPNDYLTSFSNLFSDTYIVRALMLGAVLFVLTVVVHIHKKFRESFVVLFLLLYGLLSNIPLLGYYASSYTAPLVRVSILVLFWYFFRVLPFYVRWIVERFSTKKPSPLLLNTGVIVMMMAVSVYGYLRFDYPRPHLFTRMDFLAITDQKEKIKHLGSYLQGGWIQSHRKAVNITGGNLIVNSYPYNDSNWKNGIYKILPAFFLAYSEDFDERVHLGDQVTFAKSGMRTIVDIVPNNEQWVIVYVAGDYLDAEGDGYPNRIFFNKKENMPTVWSTYSSLLEAENDIFHPTPYDYIIHALGPERRREYVKTFRRVKPVYVTTIKKNFFQYEEWLWNGHWNFYEDVLHNYEAVEKTGHSIIWKKNLDADWKRPDVWDGVIVKPESQTVDIPVPQENRDEYELMVVKVTYRLKNKFAWLPYIGQLPRYLITPINSASRTPISLPPYEREWTFPLLVQKDQQYPALRFDTASIVPGAQLFVDKIQYRKLDISRNNKQHFIDDAAWYDTPEGETIAETETYKEPEE